MDLSVPFFLLSYTCVLISGYTIELDQNRITCWTCPNKGSNLECNDWAPDKYCPHGHSVCQTVHTFSDVAGGIPMVRVEKRCVVPEKCTRQNVGCRTHKATNVKTCISCCATSYCNEEVAHDDQTAIRLSVSLIGSATCNKFSYWPVYLLGHVMMLLMTN
ncbi:ly6/PLAUR domain-containing protein 6-like [Liolophura sinensis]|uniref:ly6/PLAUR domain-containing protein 6-like n=1 Tax=Liolophura sinensis TaxID=3198878 RepID=UPI0031580C86